MLIFIGWIFFSIVSGMFARFHRDRSGIGWFLLAILFSPFVALVLLAVLPRRDTQQSIDRHYRDASGRFVSTTQRVYK